MTFPRKGFPYSLGGFYKQLVEEFTEIKASGWVTTARIEDGAVSDIKIDDGAITTAKLDSGAGVAALITAGGGASKGYTATSDGIDILLAENEPAEGNRVVLIIVTVTEAFSTEDTSQPTFKIGEAGEDDKFAATTLLIDAALNSTFVLAGVLTENKDLIVTATERGNELDTGAINVTVLALPENV